MSFRTFGEFAQETPMSPAFTLTAHTGKVVRRFDYKQRANLLLVFLDPTDPDARAYTRNLTEQYPDIKGYETEVLLFLATDAAGVATFIARTGTVPFPVLADSDCAVRDRYLSLINESDKTSAVRVAAFTTNRYSSLQRYAVADSAAHLPDAAAFDEMLQYLNSLCES